MGMNTHNASLVGYFPKVTHPGVEWLGNASVLEICSVSQCISKGPEDWINHWKHNPLGFYDSEATALEVVASDAGAFDLYAYKLYPFRCLDGIREAVELPANLDELHTAYELLGYDIATRSTTDFFECSPLSCNAGARDYPVNQYSLLPTPEVAQHILSAICESGTFEPGPYYLFEVYRKQK